MGNRPLPLIAGWGASRRHASASKTAKPRRVQRLEALEHRDRLEEVPPRIADKPFDLAFVVAFARPAETVLEQVVRLQFGKHPRSQR
jgi:hypothetical protein